MATATESVTLQLKWRHSFQSAGFYMAIEKGYYEDVGLDVKLIEGGPQKSAVQHVLQHQAAYGVSSSGVVLDRAEGKKIKALAALFQYSPLVLMVRADSSIHSWADLRGKRVMLQEGNQNAAILSALQKAGLHEGDYQRLSMSYHLDDLLVGKTDAYAAYLSDEPHHFDALGVGYRLLSPKDMGVDFYSDVLITSEQEVVDYPIRFRVFLEASLRGWKYALAHPEEAIQLILEQYNTQALNRDNLHFEAQKTIALMMPDVVTVGYMNRQRWQAIVDDYRRLGLIDASFRVDRLLSLQPPSFTAYFFYHIDKLLLFLASVFLLLMLAVAIWLRYLLVQRTASLAEREGQYAALVNMADVGVCVHRHGRLLFANPYLLRYMAEPNLASVSGHELLQYIHPDDRAEAGERLRMVFAGECDSHKASVRYVNKLGDCYQFEANTRAVLYGGEKALLTVMVDVSDYQRALLERERLQHQVDHVQRLESLGVLAGGIAHDFNNLLTVISLNTELAQMLSPSKAQEPLDNIRQTVASASALCQQMLSYAGKKKFKLEAIDLSVFLKESASLLEVSLGKQTSLHYSLADRLPKVEVSRTKLQQVLMNLLMNAADAVHDKQASGHITVLTGVQELDASSLRACLQTHAKAGTYVYFEVQDNGCGMSQKTQEQIFEPFFTTKDKGRGLGMSAILGIVRSHRGALRLRSVLGEGTSIRVFLPCADQQDLEA